MKKTHENRQNRRDIRNILLVLGGAIASACLIALYFIVFYGPTGQYIAGQTLLDPAIIERLNYQGEHPRTGKNVYFIFDRAEFSYFDQQKQQSIQKLLSSDDYDKFYRTIQSDKSLATVSSQIQTLFIASHPTLLTTTMRTGEMTKSMSQVFQVIQFVSEDYYRVQLQGKATEDQWAYFYHPHLYQDLTLLFTPASP